MRPDAVSDDPVLRLRRRFDRHEWQTVLVGQSGAAVYRLDGRETLYLKVAHPPASGPAVADVPLPEEAQRATWLRGAGLPAPEVLEVGEDGGTQWLLSAALPGVSLAGRWPPALLTACVDALADVTRALHELPLSPFVRDLSVTVPQAERAVAAGEVDEDDLDTERAGRTADDLLAELRASVPPVEDRVTCHGDLSAPNVLFDTTTGAVTGLVDLGRLGVADRHQDLALATRSLSDGDLNPHLGADLAERFLQRYGTPADPERLAFYRLLDEFF